MRESKFFAEDIIFAYPGKEIGKEEIDELDDFPGKEDFIEFYTAHNGGSFLYGARFYPENCYHVFEEEVIDRYMTMDFFLPIPVSGSDDDVDIDFIKDVTAEKHVGFDDFVLFHIPFAEDVRHNPFWIDIQSGEIKYIDFETSQNPDNAITVAFCFKDFCKRIRRHMDETMRLC